MVSTDDVRETKFLEVAGCRLQVAGGVLRGFSALVVL